MGPIPTHIQAGNAVLDDFAISYKKDKLRIGIAGYFLKQLVNSKANPETNSTLLSGGYRRQSCTTGTLPSPPPRMPRCKLKYLDIYLSSLSARGTLDTKLCQQIRYHAFFWHTMCHKCI